MDFAFPFSYALAKRLASMHTIDTSYGAIDLDDEMRAAVEAALRPIIQRRLDEVRAADAD